MISEYWRTFNESFGRAARIGLLAGAAVILAGTIFIGYLLLRTDYQVLFSELSPQDTAAMAAELDRQKIPYTLSEQENGVTAIMVDKNHVHQTRLKLMAKDLPIHGTVGFELFNNSDFGMTEFAQKINYQRALQGELTRTILSLSEIREARVLLALPEQGLFKQNVIKPKASVTLTLKAGQILRPEQVLGIQRLVAAAVPGIATQDVTLVDQTGVALTRYNGSDSENEWAAGTGLLYLDLKKDIERYLSKKAGTVLERALGNGCALASVDVVLNMDRVQTSTDEVLGATSKPDETPTGILIRERETVREPDSPLQAKSGTGTTGGSSQTENEYAVGRRVEQVISQPGTIRQIQVAVVVHRPLSEEQIKQLNQMVAASVGASPERGDTVVIQTAEALSSGQTAEAAHPETKLQAANPALKGFTQPSFAESQDTRRSFMDDLWVKRLLLGLATLGLLWIFLHSLTRRRSAAMTDTTLSAEDRQAALSRVMAWMDDTTPKDRS